MEAFAIDSGYCFERMEVDASNKREGEPLTFLHRQVE